MLVYTFHTFRVRALFYGIRIGGVSSHQLTNYLWPSDTGKRNHIISRLFGSWFCPESFSAMQNFVGTNEIINFGVQFDAAPKFHSVSSIILHKMSKKSHPFTPRSQEKNADFSMRRPWILVYFEKLCIEFWWSFEPPLEHLDRLSCFQWPI